MSGLLHTMYAHWSCSVRPQEPSEHDLLASLLVSFVSFIELFKSQVYLEKICSLVTKII